MRPNPVKKKLRAGEPSVGTWLSLASPLATRYIAQVGFDWLTVDTEHAPVSIETTALMFGAMAGTGVAPLARVPWNTGENIKRILDSGAWGIVVPMVNSPAEAEAAVAAAKYPPAGVRSVGGGLHAISFETDASTYYARANDEILVVVQAEHIDAVEHAEEILSVPGIDAVFIGPNDLMSSMHMVPKMDSEDSRYVEAVEHIRTTARKHGVAPGIHVATPEQVSRRIEEGFQFIALSSDLGAMLAGARSALNGVRGFTAEPAQGLARY